MSGHATFVVVAGALVAAGLAACGGGGPDCGNGVVESGEQCDEGDDNGGARCNFFCESALDANIQWRILADVVPGFVETCDGIGAATAHLELDGPMVAGKPPKRVSFDIECSFSQYLVSALDVGDYVVRLTLRDAEDGAVTRGQTSMAFSVVDRDVTVPLVIPLEDLESTTYRGDWFYRFTWGGATTCAAAVPPVASTRIRIESNGHVVMNEQGTPIDGSAPTECFDDQFNHAVNRLPFGHASVRITGVDAEGNAIFQGTFATFIGAGLSNPPLLYDVPSLLPDAGP